MLNRSTNKHIHKKLRSKKNLKKCINQLNKADSNNFVPSQICVINDHEQGFRDRGYMLYNKVCARNTVFGSYYFFLL